MARTLPRALVLLVVLAVALLACSGGEIAGEDGAGAGTTGSDIDDKSASPDAGGASSGQPGAGDAGAGDGDGMMSIDPVLGGADAGGVDTSGGSGGASGGSGGSGGGGRSCLRAGAYCTWATADQCCSGACDGDSCCGFLGDACDNGFGCCEGNCIGGICRCPPGTLDCGGGCVGILWNENRCGDCDTQCGDNSVCEEGQCLCDPNLFDAQFYELCEDGCFNTRSDETHCGDCTTVCSGGRQCSGGECLCPGGTLDCGSGCEDITANALRCGSCDNVCDGATEDCVNRQCVCKAGLFACTPGVCVDRQSDDTNCGTCGNTCMGAKTCQAGECKN